MRKLFDKLSVAAWFAVGVIGGIGSVCLGVAILTLVLVAVVVVLFLTHLLPRRK